MSVIRKILPGYKPLAYINNGLLLSRGYGLYSSDLHFEKIKYLGSISLNYWKRLALKSRLLSRLLRIELGPCRALENSNNVLICAAQSIFLLNVETGKITLDFQLPRGRHPLTLSEININGFIPGIYFGEYLSNPKMGPVNIYRRDVNGVWSIAYTFADGEIEHVHAVIADSQLECIYILTGDFGSGASIWQAKDNFQNIQRLTMPGQSSRACWLRSHKERIYYATDTQLEINYFSSIAVNSLINSIANNKITKYFPIVGSSIYHAENLAERLTFSTTVEPNQVGTNIYLSLLSRQKGPGIISDRACIYSGSINEGFEIILSAKKDIWPFGLLQFGSFQFPSGICPDPTLIHTYGVAVNEYDNSCILIDISDRPNV